MLEVIDHPLKAEGSIAAGRIRELRFARPPVNALNLEMFRALIAALEGAATEAAVVITGQPGLFSAGLDVRGIKQRFAARGDVFRPGDVIMHNDPYGGASHGPDVAFCVPVFDGETLLGFAVTTAHHLDIGSHTPGSCGIVDAVAALGHDDQVAASELR